MSVFLLVAAVLLAGLARFAWLVVIPLKGCKVCDGKGYDQWCRFSGRRPKFGARTARRMIHRRLRGW